MSVLATLIALLRALPPAGVYVALFDIGVAAALAYIVIRQLRSGGVRP